MYTSTNLPVRSIEELRQLPYQEMNSAEISQLRQHDPEAYKTLVNALDGIVAPVPSSEPEPVAPKKGYWRNGQWVEMEPAASFINGVRI